MQLTAIFHCRNFLKKFKISPVGTLSKFNSWPPKSPTSGFILYCTGHNAAVIKLLETEAASDGCCWEFFSSLNSRQSSYLKPVFCFFQNSSNKAECNSHIQTQELVSPHFSVDMYLLLMKTG